MTSDSMRIDVHLFVHQGESGYTDVIALLNQIIARETAMAGELDALRLQVEQNNTVIGSAITLLQGLKAALDAAIASGDPAALTALSASLGATDAALAAAITANTPAP